MQSVFISSIQRDYTEVRTAVRSLVDQALDQIGIVCRQVRERVRARLIEQGLHGRLGRLRSERPSGA